MAVNKPQAFWLIAHLCAVTFLLCMLTSQTEARVSRIKRQDCQSGTYEHEGRDCCKCPAGQKVKEHCTALSQRKCELCKEGEEFRSQASSEMTCEPCSSCAQENVNQVIDRPCTAYSDTVCKCKDNHYCSNGQPHCKICEPCKVCGPEGEKEACSLTSDTICNDKSQDHSLGIALGVISVLAVVGVIVGWFFWKKRKSGRKNIDVQAESSEVQIPLQPKVKKLGPHIPEVAEVIGWSTMKNLAIQSEIPNGIIESCESRKDGVENTIELLRVWEEKAGNSASSKLIESLKKNNQNSKAERVLEILRDGSKATLCEF